MEDKKLRELSKEFLRNNVVSHSINLEGKIMHKFKNGRIRRIDLFKRFVQIFDKDNNQLYSNILDDSHPLIKCADLYYKCHYMKKHACVGYLEYLKLEREKKSVLSQIEEIYFLV